MRWIAVALWVALATAGCGGERSPASVVPADVPVYVSVAAGDVPRPPGVGVPAQLLLDSFGLDGVDYRRDVAPWIGERAAFFAMSDTPDALEEADALVLGTRDEKAARAFGDRVRLGRRFRVTEIVDGQLVLATSRELLEASIDAAENGALADSDRFDPGDERGDDAPAAVLAAFDRRTAARATEGIEPLGLHTHSALAELLPAEGAATARVWPDSHSVRLEIEGLGPPGPPAPTLENLPAGTWLAAATPDLGKIVLTGASIANFASSFQRFQLAAGVDVDNDVLPQLGAATFHAYGDGENELGARLRVEARDEAALRRAAVAVGRALRRTDGVSGTEVRNLPEIGLLELSAEIDGLDPTDSGFPAPLHVQIDDGYLDAELGDGPGAAPEDFGETSLYRDAERRLGRPPELLIDLDRLSALLPATEGLGGRYLAGARIMKGARRVDRYVLELTR